MLRGVAMESDKGLGAELERLRGTLEGADVSWGVAAGAAVYLYTGSRFPTDLDVLVMPESLGRVGGLLGRAPIREETPWGHVSKICLGRTEIVGTLVVTVGEESYPYCMDRAMAEHLRPAVFEGIEVPVLSPEDLVALKAVLQRGPEQGKHDLEDVAALAARLEIDRGYLRLRLRLMGAEERARPVLQRWGWA